MLENTADAARLETPHERPRVGRHCVGVAAERPAVVADRRVTGILEVDDGRKVQIEPEARHRASGLLIERLRLGDGMVRRDLPGGGKLGAAVRLDQPLDGASLVIDGDNHFSRPPGRKKPHKPLDVVPVADIVLNEDDSADRAGANLVRERLRRGRLGVAARKTGDEQFAVIARIWSVGAVAVNRALSAPTSAADAPATPSRKLRRSILLRGSGISSQ